MKIVDGPFLVVDFETYYKAKKKPKAEPGSPEDKYSLRGSTIPEYVSDPRFKLYGAAVYDGVNPAYFRHCSEIDLATYAKTHVFVFHNAYFDDYIMGKVLKIMPDRILDTRLLYLFLNGGEKGCAHTGGAGLGNIAKRLNLKSGAKGDLSFMSGVIDPNEEEWNKLAEYAEQDAMLTWDILKELLPKIPPLELEVMMHTVRLFTDTRKGVILDMPGLEKLRGDADEKYNAVYKQAGVSKTTISSNKLFVAKLTEALAVTKRSIPLKKGKKGLIPATAKDDREMIKLSEDDDEGVRNLCLARVAKGSHDNIISRLNRLSDSEACGGGVLPIYLKYYGCHTGRYSGGGACNFHNMGRSGLGLRTRELLKPRNGKFIIADLAQIEARTLAYYAGQFDLILLFANGEDVYGSFGTETFGEEVRKAKASEGLPEDVFKRLNLLRGVSKTAVLGLGYGMGVIRYIEQTKTDLRNAGMMDESLFKEGGMLSPLKMRAIQRGYRGKYLDIVNLWDSLEADLTACVTKEYGETSSPFRITYDRKDGKIHLPSGRFLLYDDLRIVKGEGRKIKIIDKNGKERMIKVGEEQLTYGKSTGIYGGLLTENVMQAISRDVLTEQILAIEEAGYPIAFHVHDEVILDVPESKVEDALKTVNEIMSTAPKWAPGLPLAVEAEVAVCYGK